MNLHQLSVKVAKKESGKKQVSIAQIKEIIKIIGIELADDFDDFQRNIKNLEYPVTYFNMVKAGRRANRKTVK